MSVEITGSSGVITTPLYPEIFTRYDHGYSYRITVKFGMYISLVLKEFVTKSDSTIGVRSFFFSSSSFTSDSLVGSLKTIFLFSSDL